MLGWKGKIGLLVPSCNCNMEPHAYKMVPEGVTVHAGRLRTEKEVTHEALEELTKDIELETKKLASIPVNVVLFGCTSGSLIEGPEYDQKIIELIERSSEGIPGLTTSTAVIQALKALGLKKIAVATPYIKEINDAVIRFLEGNGFTVTSLKGLNLKTFISQQPPYVLYNLAYSAYKESTDTDGIFISCTAARSPEVIEDLERNTGKPVVTSTQASIWAALRRIGVKESIKGFGQLMEKY